ncbi:transglutaminase domain-containing protein [Candidatus Daviesbacteria bacterium]|nr:transglutaminase domain-containing protein [Candidatus Daviesbacteria bacterium]
MFKKILLVFCLFFALFFVPKTYAQEFATSYDVVYDISSDGITTVTEKVTLRNLTSQYYASEFKLTIGATDIFDIKGSDPGGALEVSSKLQDTSTIITVKFNQQVAGLGKEIPWTLQFKSKDFAERIGKIWEVRAPRISSVSNLENYNLTLSVPQSFGEPTLISPTPKSQTSSSGKVFFTFNKDQLATAGVSASFGNNQLFDFDLTFHLENNNIVPILTNIALPPDTAFQDVIFQRITPPPVNVTVDLDGNYLAWYKLTRGQRLDVKVLGSAKLYTTSKAKEPVISENLRKKYTEGSKYWEKDNPQIMTTLEGILGANPPADSSKKVELIYRYVVNSLKYNPARLKEGNIERLGATTVLSNPTSAVCMEFTDLFIALARAAGIAARELDGFAYTANPALRPLSLTKDVLHAWPEYWNERKGWVMVDPTWENTTGGVDYFNKLDLNHFVFAIRGASSEQPVPAGSYKYIGQDSHDVKVSLTDVDFLGKPAIGVQIDVPKTIFAGFPSKIKVNITNSGNAVFPSAAFAVGSKKISILDSLSKNLGPIPAFGMVTFEYNIRTKSLFDKFDDEIAVYVGSMKFTKGLSVEPFFLFQTIPLFAMGIVLAMVILYGAILAVLLYRRRFLKKSQKK